MLLGENLWPEYLLTGSHCAKLFWAYEPDNPQKESALFEKKICSTSQSHICRIIPLVSNDNHDFRGWLTFSKILPKKKYSQSQNRKAYQIVLPDWDCRPLFSFGESGQRSALKQFWSTQVQGVIDLFVQVFRLHTVGLNRLTAHFKANNARELWNLVLLQFASCTWFIFVQFPCWRVTAFFRHSSLLENALHNGSFGLRPCHSHKLPTSVDHSTIFFMLSFEIFVAFSRLLMMERSPRITASRTQWMSPENTTIYLASSDPCAFAPRVCNVRIHDLHTYTGTLYRIPHTYCIYNIYNVDLWWFCVAFEDQWS